MSVRVTERLIGDVVIVTGLANSPKMVVQSIEEEAKIVTTSWFSDCHEYQEGYFPGTALDRVESTPAPKQKKAAAGQKAAAGKGKKPAK